MPKLGKFATEILRRLHTGHILVERHNYQVAGKFDGNRYVTAIPETDDPRKPRLLLDFDYPREDKGLSFSLDRGAELIDAGLVGPVEEHEPYVFCLTPEGLAAAVHLFGSPFTPPFVRAQGERPVLTAEECELLATVFRGEITEKDFAERLKCDWRMLWTMIAAIDDGPLAEAYAAWQQRRADAARAAAPG